MFFIAMLINALHSAFEDREKAFNGIGGNVATGVFAVAVHNGFVRGKYAIRASVAAKSNMTYKLLFNDAVAMTGGQAAESGFTPAQITRQLASEGVAKIVIVAAEPDLIEEFEAEARRSAIGRPGGEKGVEAKTIAVSVQPRPDPLAR